MYSEKGDYGLSVCFSPLSWPLFRQEEAVVIVADIFRATTAICAAFHNGVEAIIPVESIQESESYKARGYVSAGERDGKKLDCADFGNSPFNFMAPALRRKTIVMNTTNGTKAIRMAASQANTVLIGSFINLDAVCQCAMAQNRPVTVLCAGWKDRFSMEDSLFAGAVVHTILDHARDRFHTVCDSAIASADLWMMARENPLQYMEKAAHRHRLKKMGLDDILEYSLTPNTSRIVPIFKNDRIIIDRK